MIIDAKQYSGVCSCGKEHTMSTEIAVIEAGCLKDFDKYRKRFFPNAKEITAVYDTNTYEAVTDRRPETEKEVVFSPKNLHADENACACLLSQLSPTTDLLVAVGSGTIHDITRYVAYEKGIPFISCPTAASVDGFCSSVAAMTWKGYKKTFTAVAPKLVLADIDIIANAPMRLTRSGFGDIMGKYIALADWKIANAVTGEFLCEEIYKLTYEATESVLECADSLEEDKQSVEKLTYGLIMSGLAMQMMGNSRPASGAEHHISHLIEMQPIGLNVSSSALHGEKVGVATLLLAEEYRKLAEREIDWKDYTPMSQERIFAMFGERLTDGVLEENREGYAISGETLNARWGKIREILREIPDKERLLKKYESLQAKTTLQDIEVDEKLKDLLLFYAPLVRNRLTFLRLRQV